MLKLDSLCDNSPAVNVKLTDEWPAETFTVVEGQETYEFASINA